MRDRSHLSLLRGRRLAELVLVLVLVALCAATVVIASSRSSTEPSDAERARDALAPLRGLPQHGIVLGRPDAATTLTAYVDPLAASDLLRPEVFDHVVADYLRPGRLQIKLRTVAAADDASGGELLAATTLQAAGLQNLMWDYYATLDATSLGYLDDVQVRRVAGLVPNLDERALVGDASTPRVAKAVARAGAYARADGVRATPGYVVRAGTGGTPIRLHGPLVPALDRAMRTLGSSAAG